VAESAFSRRAFIRSSVALSAAGLAASVAGSRSAVGATAAFYVPLDGMPHQRTWMSWPDSKAIWGQRLSGMQANISLVARTIARYEPVIMCANSGSVSAALSQCGSSVKVIGSIPVDDCWMRDSGPIFRINGSGAKDAVGLNFNGWGNKQAHGNDALVASRIAAYAGVPFIAAAYVAEGGAIETDGSGTLMATQSSIVNANRNPGMTQLELVVKMCATFGASKVIWFPGIVGKDITDDHVDATSRFTAQGTGLVQWPQTAATDIWSKDGRQQYQILAASTDAHGAAMSVSKLIGPNLSKIRQTSEDFVSSYANYYICNGAVIAAKFGDAEFDAAAKTALASVFPGYVIEQLDIDHLGNGGGGIHCVTQQEPMP